MMDINSIINFIKNKKQYIHDVNIKKKLDLKKIGKIV